jgi:hypothetical protein
MRFVFSPPADAAAGLLTLPWDEPLASWRDSRLVEIRQRGLSRHVVRFVADSGELYALKSISERLARREYRLLRDLAALNVPAVEVVGVVVDRGADPDAILVTRYLDYCTTYRAQFSAPRGGQPADRLLDALVELLARLHLSGFFWGDCSLSNALFRSDAGALEAYLVDAETSERHAVLTSGQRGWDLELAAERVFGELCDLRAGDLLPPEVDPFDIIEKLQRRYARLWDELTREEILTPGDQRYRIARRLARLNELGFEADEVELVSHPDGGLRPGGGGHPGRAARPAVTAGDLPRDPGAPLVPVRGGRRRRRHHSGRPVLLRHRAARRPRAAGRGSLTYRAATSRHCIPRPTGPCSSDRTLAATPAPAGPAAVTASR